MNKNDFLVIDPMGNVALVTADEYRRMAAAVNPCYNVLMRNSPRNYTVRKIAEAKRCVEAYLRGQWNK